MNQSQPVWNSLEVVRIIIGVTTPLVVLWLGYLINRVYHRLEQAKWANQKIIEKRIALFDEVAPKLNDLYCYFRFVGNWKELAPIEIIARKRELDREMNVYKPLISQALFDFYNKFIQLCFKTYVEPEHDAQLRTEIETHHGNRKNSYTKGWKSEWDKLFASPADVASRNEIRQLYDQLMGEFSKELGIIDLKTDPKR